MIWYFVKHNVSISAFYNGDEATYFTKPVISNNRNPFPTAKVNYDLGEFTLRNVDYDSDIYKNLMVYDFGSASDKYKVVINDKKIIIREDGSNRDTSKIMVVLEVNSVGTGKALGMHYGPFEKQYTINKVNIMNGGESKFGFIKTLIGSDNGLYFYDDGLNGLYALMTYQKINAHAFSPKYAIYLTK